MSAPQIDEARLPGDLGSLANTMSPQPSGLILPGHLEPAEAAIEDTGLASVTALPSVEATAPLEPITEPEFTAVPQPPAVAALPVDRPEPTTIQPVLQREPTESALTSSAVSAPSTPEPPPAAPATPAPEPAPLTDPATTWTPFRWEQGYPVIYWASVIIGLVSQIIGWSQVFTTVPLLVAVVGAVVVGGICELTMVTASDKGLNWVAQNRPAREIVPFLLVATTAACIAVYMVYTHWSGTLGLYLAIVSAAGFIGHMLDGWFKAKRQRRKVQDYDRRRAEAAERAEFEAEQQRQAAAEAERQRAAAADAAVYLNRDLPRPSRKNAQVSKHAAITLGVQQRTTTLSELKTAISNAGFTLRSDSSLKNYLGEIKQYLA